MIIKSNDFIIKSVGLYYRYSTVENRDGSLVVMDANSTDFKHFTMSKEKAEKVINRITFIQEAVANPEVGLIDLDEIIDNI